MKDVAKKLYFTIRQPHPDLYVSARTMHLNYFKEHRAGPANLIQAYLAKMLKDDSEKKNRQQWRNRSRPAKEMTKAVKTTGVF